MLGRQTVFPGGQAPLILAAVRHRTGGGFAFWLPSSGRASRSVRLRFSCFNGLPFGFFIFGRALGDALGAVVCAFLLQRFVKFENALERTRDAAAYLLLACGLGTTVNALFNMVGLVYGHKISPDGMFSSFLDWWVPNAMAVLVVTPFIITWSTSSSVRLNFWRGLEAGVCAGGIDLRNAHCLRYLVCLSAWRNIRWPICPTRFWSGARCGSVRAGRPPAR